MGCSQSTPVHEQDSATERKFKAVMKNGNAKQDQAASMSHSFGAKKYRVDVAKLTASSSGNLDDSTMSNISKLEEIRKSVLQVNGSVEVECEGPEVLKDYDSWQHEVDAHDLKAMQNGHAIPVNRTAHLHLAKKMESSLSELTEDHAKLKRAVRLRRMSEEELVAYKNMMALNGGGAEGEKSKQSKKQRKEQPLATL